MSKLISRVFSGIDRHRIYKYVFLAACFGLIAVLMTVLALTIRDSIGLQKVEPFYKKSQIDGENYVCLAGKDANPEYCNLERFFKGIIFDNIYRVVCYSVIYVFVPVFLFLLVDGLYVSGMNFLEKNNHFKPNIKLLILILVFITIVISILWALGII